MKLVKNEITGMDLISAIGSKESKISLPMLEMSLTVADTLSRPQIRSVFKGEDQSKIGFTFVNGLVKRFMDSFGFSKRMSESEIQMLTVDTLESFSYESIEDIIIFFKMCRSGKFGTTQRGVDSNLVYGEWFPQYMELKSIERESNYQTEKSNYTHTKATDEDVMLTYQKLADRKISEYNREKADQMIAKMDRQMLEDTIKEWEKDPKMKKGVKYLKSKRRSVK